MTNTKISKSLFVILIAVILVLILCYYYFNSFRCIPIYGRLDAVIGDIKFQYKTLGLLPPKNSTDYLRNEWGSRAQILGHTVKTWGGYAHDFEIKTETKSDVVMVIARVKFTKAKNDARNGVVQEKSWKFKRNPFYQTHQLLKSLSGGPAYWKYHLLSGPNFQYVFPDGERNCLPYIAFELPSNVSELKEYKIWLVKLAGPSYRFHDGWQRDVSLTLANRNAKRILIVSSAGPDGKWSTRDDMIIKRDTRTGKIVEAVGLN